MNVALRNKISLSKRCLSWTWLPNKKYHLLWWTGIILLFNVFFFTCTKQSTLFQFHMKTQYRFFKKIRWMNEKNKRFTLNLLKNFDWVNTVPFIHFMFFFSKKICFWSSEFYSYIRCEGSMIVLFVNSGITLFLNDYDFLLVMWTCHNKRYLF